MQLKLKAIVNPSYSRVFLYAVLAALVWAVASVGAFHAYGEPFGGFWQDVSARISDGWVWKNVAGFVLTLLNAVLLSQLVSRFSFVRTRTFLPVVVFVLLVAVWEPSHALVLSHAALLLFVMALFQFLDMYQNPAATEKAFLGMVLVACASLLVNDLLFVIPVCWLGFLALRSFSLRTFLASVFGVLAPWLLYVAGCYAMRGALGLSGLVDLRFSLGFGMDGLMFPTKCYIVLLFVMFFILLVGTFSDFHQKANNTRKNISFMLVLLVYFIATFLLQTDFDGTLFPFIALCFAIFLSNVYSTRQNNFYYGIFLVFLAVNFLFLLFNFFW